MHNNVLHCERYALLDKAPPDADFEPSPRVSLVETPESHNSKGEAM